MSHIFLVEFVKKVLKINFILIICSEILVKKIDYVACLVHALLNYLIVWVIFSTNRFSKTFAGLLFPDWFHPWNIVHCRGVRVPIPQSSVPKEREPIFKSIFIDVFEMIESSHTLVLSFRGNLLWLQDS